MARPLVQFGLELAGTLQPNGVHCNATVLHRQVDHAVARPLVQVRARSQYTATQPYYIVCTPRAARQNTICNTKLLQIKSFSFDDPSLARPGPYPRAPAHRQAPRPALSSRATTPAHDHATSPLHAHAHITRTLVAPHRIVGHRAAGPGLYRGSYFRSCPLARRYTQRPHNEAHDHAPHLAPPGKRRGGCW